MLKYVLCRFNSVTPRSFVRITRNFSAVESQLKSEYEHKKQKSYYSRKFIAYTSVPTFLAFFKKKEDEQEATESSFWDKILPEDLAILVKKKPVEDETTPEGKLKTTLKRTILAIRRREFEKAEQMAHLALRMAQDIQSYDSITLCYDIMANLAMDREQHQKAQQLFESVLQRLLEKGVSQDDIQILHLSLKVAQLVEAQGKIDEAKTNYIWTLNKLETKLKMTEADNNDEDLQELWGLANSYYGNYLIRHGKFKEAAQRLRIAQQVYVKVRGRYEPEYIDIVNDLAVACLEIRDYDSADLYIDEALRLASAYPEKLETGIYHANKALICLRRGLLEVAEKYCQHAYKASQRSGDADGKEQAKYCLEQVKKAMKK